MSDKALHLYERAQSAQHVRNEARRIRTRVTEARGKPNAAAIRWPFELMQNALDTGPRAGRTTVTIAVKRTDEKVVFEHDGAPFTSVELAALLSGGSSKEFESETTTGRFGTGFLATHVLAERVQLRGLFDVGSHLEVFELDLDRGGDEDKILRNIEACNASIKDATEASEADEKASARFEYQVGNDRATFLSGFDSLVRALPYLYGTRPALGVVRMEPEDGVMEAWVPGGSESFQFEDGLVETRSISVQRTGASDRELRVWRFTTESDAAAALFVGERTSLGWKVSLPTAETPRIFREYPLRETTFLPIEFVLDGKFDPDQERARLLMGEEDRKLIERALSAAVLGVKFATHQNMESAHLLAQVGRPNTSFDSTRNEEVEWWCASLQVLASRLARLPLVDCGQSGLLPAKVDDGPFADFVVPKLLPSSTRDETSVDRLWPLVAAASALCPPISPLARDWTRICEGWHDLGVDLESNRITVQKLATSVREDATRLGDLAVDGERAEWLAHFIDIVGECWAQREGSYLTVLDGLLPNQNLQLCRPQELRWDVDISDALKDVCANLGQDVRATLLLNRLREIGDRENLQFLESALTTAVSVRLTEDDVISEITQHLSKQLPEDEDCEGEGAGLQAGSVRLLSYLWQARGEGGAQLARGLPLISRRSRVVRWSPDRLMMAPVSTWHEAARPFAAAYPDGRVLSEVYVGSDQVPGCVRALAAWGIAIPDPLSGDEPVELRDRRLAALSTMSTEGMVVSGVKFSQIALLPREVINHCRVGLEEAKALLGLVLMYVARHDPEWQVERNVKARRAREDVDVTLKGALWLADLRFMPWVPVSEEENEAVVPHLANITTLTTILDPKWLENNDPAIKLLSQYFGFDELELRLLGLASDADQRRELRSSLARLVESGGADASLYASLARELEARQSRERDIEYCRRLGLAVQEAVRQALEDRGLKLVLIDHGFDYEVTSPPENALDDLGSSVSVGSHLLEIKATTRGGACLTPTQALTASSHANFVLCVVDLRGVPSDDLEGEWSGEKVEPLARVVTGIGGAVVETWRHVEAARESTVGIKNDSALRYEVPNEVWEHGVTIGEWVAALQSPQ